VQNVALLFHLLGAFLFISGIVLAGVSFEVGRRREQPAEIALILGIARIAVLFVAVGGLLVGVFGLWLVHLGHFGYGSGWVNGAIALFIVVLALGAIGGQTPKRARLLASGLAADGAPVSEELRALLDDKRSRAINYGALVILVAIIVLMVFK
jgi:uncharacterized membrane protein